MVAGAYAMAKPGCQSTCGDLVVPYPFGMGADYCYRQGFEVECNVTTSKAYIGKETSNLEITNITLFTPQLRFLTYAAHDCYSRAGTKNSTFKGWVDLKISPYVFSDTENVFVSTGCDTIAFIQGTRGKNYLGGCVSVCSDKEGIPEGTCSGIGCCETPIPKGLKKYSASLASVSNHSDCIDFNPCSFAFMVDRNNYTFRLSDLNNQDLQQRYPIVLDWSIGNQTCQQAQKERSSNSGAVDDGGYACVSSNSECLNATNGSGYSCKCSEGYTGNPYLPEGCKDIDECESPSTNCKGVCTNTPGSYTCTCKLDTHGNATGDGCVPDFKREMPLLHKLGIGIGGGGLLFIIIISWIYLGNQKMKFLKMKEQFFKHNGGMVLREKLSRGHSNNFTIYTVQELKKATNDYDQKCIIGKGGNGVVYKGTLRDHTTIAIKRSIMVDDKKSTEFANEMIILSQINHANVVKLLGCCLEVEVPILVYEFVPQGTLFQLIHNRGSGFPFSWDLRLKIATESAKALSYLHCDVSTPILHGDVKSSNILLDENLKAKVSDFGTSTLAPKDKAQFLTLVQGTYGYLDPECLQTCQLTLKSDVYSFGVVLAELITRKTALYKDGTEEEKCLALSFSSCVKNNRLLDILDPDVQDESLLPEIQVVADMAVQCLSIRGDDRPTMTDVYMELQALRRPDAHPWVRQDPEETQRLMDGNLDSSGVDVTASINMDNYLVNIGGR